MDNLKKTTAVIAKLVNEISNILRTSAIGRVNKKIGRIVLNLVERNMENNKRESQTQVLGNKKVKDIEIKGGYKTNNAGRKTCGFPMHFRKRAL